MTDLPEPLTPPYCDLRGSDWMPLHGHKLEGSDFDSLASDTEYRAAHRLWWAAWQAQVPAASLPDNDRILCNLAGFQRDPKGWEKVRAMVLHGFIKCSDGRLYHQFLAGAAIHSYELRLKASSKREQDRKRLQDWRDKQAKKSGGNDVGNTTRNDDETPGETSDETDVETRFVGRRYDRIRQDKIESKKEPPYPQRQAAAPSGGRSVCGADFERFWAAYPRKKAKGAARKAWLSAIKRAKVDTIISAVGSQKFDHRLNFVPHPATWLNADQWLDEGQAGDPVLRAVGLSDDGQIIGNAEEIPKWLLLNGGQA